MLNKVNQSNYQHSSWTNSKYAQQYFATEREFLATGLRQAVGPCVLQLGDLLDGSVIEQLDLPYVVKAKCQAMDKKQDLLIGDDEQVVIDPAFLPFEVDSFSTVLVPHILELHSLPHQVLREAHRVLMPEGHLVTTGFSPSSLIGLQKLIYKRAVPSGRYYTARRVIDWLQLLGFDITASAMFQYAPLSQQNGVTKTFALFESVMGRCLPMTGGAYMITAKKRVHNSNLVGKLSVEKKRLKLVSATAKQLNSNSTSSKG